MPSKFEARRPPGACPRRETLVWRDLVKISWGVAETARGPVSPRRAPPAAYRPPPNGMMQGYKRRSRKVRSDAGSCRDRSTSEGTGGGPHPTTPQDRSLLTPFPHPPVAPSQVQGPHVMASCQGLDGPVRAGLPLYAGCIYREESKNTHRKKWGVIFGT